MGKPKNPYAKPDRFTQRAKEEGYAARSVYKLSEIDQKYRLLRGAMKVVDLGCAPGSWSKYALEHIGTLGRLVGIDLTPVDMAGGIFLQRSIMDVPPEEIQELLGGRADVVLSDMAPLTSGVALTDHVLQLELATMALEVAKSILVPGGAFVCKVFDGEDAPAFVLTVRKSFAETKRVRPEAVRSNSKEFFLVCTGFKPGA